MGVQNDIKTLLQKIRGKDSDRVRIGGQNTNGGDGKGATMLQRPQQREEGIKRGKFEQMIQYTRQKSFSRKHNQWFEDYKRMDETFPIIKGALDIYAEEICAKDTDGNVISITGSNEKVIKELKTLFFNYLDINSSAFLIARGMVQFGNQYLYLVARDGEGIIDKLFLPPNEIVREDMYNPEDLRSYRFRWFGGTSNFFDSIDLAHFRNVEDVELLPYGTSVLRSIVDTWRRVVLMREALVIYRIVRAPSRLLFKVGTDGLTGEEAFQFTKDMKKEFTRSPVVNPETGLIDFTYNPISIEDNIYLPTFEGDVSDVTVLDGASNLAEVEDYKIIKDDIFAGLKIPKSWLTFEEEMSNKASLAEEDVRFAKTVQRFQSNLVNEFIHIGLVHLAYLGFSEKDMQSFTITMHNPSTSNESKHIELLQKRYEVAEKSWNPDKAGFNFNSFIATCRDILKMSDKEIMQSLKDQFLEQQLMKKLTTIKEGEDKVKQTPEEVANMLPPSPTSGFDNLRFEAVLKDAQKYLDDLLPVVKTANPANVQMVMEQTKQRNPNILSKNIEEIQNLLND